MLNRFPKAAASARSRALLAHRLVSTHKDIAYGSDARDAIARGVEKLTRAVSVTLGPKGRNVLIEQQYSAPKITKDGVTVAKSIVLEHRFENIGARLVQDVANKTNEAAGDGTTTATVLAHALYTEGLKAVGYGCNPNDLRRGIQKAVTAVVEYLKRNARPVESECQIKQIATISANGDTRIGDVIASAMRDVRKEGVITIKEGKTMSDSIEITQGMRFDRGYISPFFATNPKNQKCEYERPLVLISSDKISQAQQLLPAVEQAVAARRPLLIIAEDVDGEALALLIVNKLRSALNVVAVRAPGFGDNRSAMLQDIATLTGSKLFSEEVGDKLEKVVLADLGECASISVCKENTTLLGGNGEAKDVERRCDSIREAIKNTTSDYEKEKLQERLAKLSEGVAVISVGGSSEVEVGERKDRFVDSLHATRAAVEEGVLPGGGIALLRSASVLDSVVTANDDEKHGVDIVRRALVAPTSTIVRNAGGSGAFVVRMLTDPEMSGGANTGFAMGYNAANETYTDMFATGIIDPLKVVRTALVDASSVASLLTTSECVIVDAPAKKDDAMVAGGAGGMMGAGGMGF